MTRAISATLALAIMGAMVGAAWWAVWQIEYAKPVQWSCVVIDGRVHHVRVPQ